MALDEAQAVSVVVQWKQTERDEVPFGGLLASCAACSGKFTPTPG